MSNTTSTNDYNVLFPGNLIPYIEVYYLFLKNEEDFKKFHTDLGEQEFALCVTFHPNVVQLAIINGYFPMAVEIMETLFFACKLHVARCLLQFDRDQLKISKSTRKISKKYHLSVNKQFDEVMRKCHEAHGEDWLCAKLRKSFKYIFEHPNDFKVNIISIELWQGETLVSGELGYTFGSIYTSLTGYYDVKSTGTIQLCALGRHLQKCGFQVWDFGMELDYKTGLGAKPVPRSEWLIVSENMGKNESRDMNSFIIDKTNAQTIIRDPLPLNENKIIVEG